MSHVTTIDIHITDLDCLKRAAKAIGMEFREGQQSYRWYGKHVGDYAVPEGFKVEDLGKCEHAISVQGNTSAYEVGVVKRRDGKPGYGLIWDFWAGGKGLEAVVGENASKLRQHYAAEVAAKQMRKQGYRVSVTKKDNQLRLSCTQ